MDGHAEKIGKGTAGIPACTAFGPGPLSGFRLTLGFTIVVAMT